MICQEHNSYKIAFDLSNIVWPIVKKWDFLARDTIGKQLIRAADSISSNIAEGWQRYYKKDKILFFNYAKGSFYEVLDWLAKARRRNLISQGEYQIINNLVREFPREINGLIKGVRINLKR